MTKNQTKRLEIKNNKKYFIKYFFGPLWGAAILKVIFGFLLLEISNIFLAMNHDYYDQYHYFGWPLAYKESWAHRMCLDMCDHFTLSAFLIDVIFWYLISCLLIFVTFLLFKHLRNTYRKKQEN